MSRLVLTAVSFLYPAYASYKALALSSSPHASNVFGQVAGYAHGQAHPGGQAEADRQVERWLMYWTVVGVWTGFEWTGEWLVSWIPFYSIIKTLFFLYLALPQTEGSTLIFTHALAPAFAEHETDIDAFLAGLRVRAGAGIMHAVQWLWAKVVEQVQRSQGGQQAFAGPYAAQDPSHPDGTGLQGFMHRQPAIGPQPPTLQDPASGNVAWMYAMASRAAMTYLPVAANAIAAAVRPAGPTRPNQPRSVSSFSRDPGSEGYDVPSALAGADRRSASGTYASSLPPTQSARMRTASGRGDTSHHERVASSSSFASSSNSDEEPRTQRSSWGGASGYEEIRREDAQGADEVRPPPGRGSSWFGWGSPGGGYAPVDKGKTE